MKRAAPSSTPPRWPVLQAAADWHQIDFISDLHLHANATATFSAWQNYLQDTPADALFVLGDLFDVWVGDDVINATTPPSFERECAQILKAATLRFPIFFLHGNRDFLIGVEFAAATGITLLHDPSILLFGGQRWLLAHGDALCLADTDYMQFHAKVRNSAWQREFLSHPLQQRQQIAADLRQQSEAHKYASMAWIDLDSEASCDWLHSAQADTLIHGHTHHPGEHKLAEGLRRIVLSDWDAAATPPRAEVLRLSSAMHGQACKLERLSLTKLSRSN